MNSGTSEGDPILLDGRVEAFCLRTKPHDRKTLWISRERKTGVARAELMSMEAQETEVAAMATSTQKVLFHMVASSR